MSVQEQSLTADGLLVATFLLGDAAFGIDAGQVQEVSKVGEITRVHRAPPGVVGIRNLRGRIVTVIDLRTRLGLGQVAPAPDNRILIVGAQGETIGLLVDAVEDAIWTNQDALEPPPSNMPGPQSRFLQGVCRGEGRLVSLLDLGVLLESEEWIPADQARDRGSP